MPAATSRPLVPVQSLIPTFLVNKEPKSPQLPLSMAGPSVSGSIGDSNAPSRRLAPEPAAPDSDDDEFGAILELSSTEFDQLAHKRARPVVGAEREPCSSGGWAWPHASRERRADATGSTATAISEPNDTEASRSPSPIRGVSASKRSSRAPSAAAAHQSRSSAPPVQTTAPQLAPHVRSSGSAPPLRSPERKNTPLVPVRRRRRLIASDEEDGPSTPPSRSRTIAAGSGDDSDDDVILQLPGSPRSKGKARAASPPGPGTAVRKATNGILSDPESEDELPRTRPQSKGKGRAVAIDDPSDLDDDDFVMFDPAGRSGSPVGPLSPKAVSSSNVTGTSRNTAIDVDDSDEYDEYDEDLDYSAVPFPAEGLEVPWYMKGPKAPEADKGRAARARAIGAANGVAPSTPAAATRTPGSSIMSNGIDLTTLGLSARRPAAAAANGASPASATPSKAPSAPQFDDLKLINDLPAEWQEFYRTHWRRKSVVREDDEDPDDFAEDEPAVFRAPSSSRAARGGAKRARGFRRGGRGRGWGRGRKETWGTGGEL